MGSSACQVELENDLHKKLKLISPFIRNIHTINVVRCANFFLAVLEQI